MQQISLIQEAQDDDIVCVQEVAAKIKKEPTATQKMIAELERLLKDCADELSLNIAYCKNAPTIKNRAWQLHDKIRNVIGED